MPSYDCSTCTARQKVARGCEAPAKDKVVLDGVKLTRCPRRPFLDEGDGIADVLWYYKGYKSGMLPVSGGLLDQPAQLMELFRVIDGAVATVETAKEAEAERKRRADATRARGGRGGRR